MTKTITAITPNSGVEYTATATDEVYTYIGKSSVMFQVEVPSKGVSFASASV